MNTVKIRQGWYQQALEAGKGQEKKEGKSVPECLEEKKGTFVIEVEYRRNATWQGTIRWIEGEKKQHFRSELELVALMEDALEQETDRKAAPTKKENTDNSKNKN